MKILSKERCFIILECALVAMIVAIAGYIRLHDIASITAADLQPDEPRIALGSAMIAKYKIAILNFESVHETPLSLYLPIPFFLIFGWGFPVFKIASVFYGLAGIILTYCFSREYFSTRVAFVSAAGLSVSPFFIHFNKVMVEHTFLPFFSGLAMFCYAKHLKTGNFRWLGFCAFSMGLGISTKIVFIYVIVAFCAALIISGEMRKLRVKKFEWLRIFAWFIAGAFPFVLFVLLNQGFADALKSSASGAGMGHDFNYFKTGIAHRYKCVDAEFSYGVSISLICWAALFAARKKLSDTRPVFLFSFILIFLAFSTVTISGMQIEQTFAMVPVFAVFAASAIDIFSFIPVVSASLSAIVCAALLSFSKTDIKMPPGTSWKSMDKMQVQLKLIKSSETIAIQRDITMLHKYQEYQKTGDLPDYKVSGVVSFYCNRFKPCRGYGKWSTYPDINLLYQLSLYDHGVDLTRFFNPEMYSNPGFEQILRELIIDLISNRGFKNIISPVSKENKAYIKEIDRMTINILEDLNSEGLIELKKKTILDGDDGYRIYSIKKINRKLK